MAEKIEAPEQKPDENKGFKLDEKMWGFLKKNMDIFYGLLVIIFLKAAVYDFNLVFAVSFVIFMLVVNWILEITEKPSATKRFLTDKLLPMTMFLVAYLGLRLAIGQIFNMPLAESQKAVNEGVGLFSVANDGTANPLVLEFLFIPVGAGPAYLFVKGGTKTKTFLYLVFLAAFAVVLWDARQKNHAAAMKRYGQSSVDLHTTHLNAKAVEKEAQSKMVIAVVTEPFPGFPSGTRLLVTGEKPVKMNNEQCIEVVPEIEGFFVGEKQFVSVRKIKILPVIDDEKPKGEGGEKKGAAREYQTYHPGTYNFSLKAGETLSPGIEFPYGRKTSWEITSSDKLYKVIFDDGSVYDGRSKEQVNKNYPRFKIKAVTDQPDIKMVVY